MSETESFVKHSERLTDIFGYWPSFHDAEIIEIHLRRGDIDLDRNRYVFPVLTVKLHLWELTNETNASGGLVMRHHTIARLRFHDVEDDFELAGFNYENAIFSLTITRCERDEGPSPVLEVRFQKSFGMEAKFTCRQAEVLDAVPCDENGKLLGG